MRLIARHAALLSFVGSVALLASSAGRVASLSGPPGLSSAAVVDTALPNTMPLAAAFTAARVQPAAPRPATEQGWTFCARAGGDLCSFSGTRDVRLIAANGEQVVQTAFQVMRCNRFAFRQVLSDGAREERCEYGPVKTEDVPIASPGAPGLGRVVAVPLGDPGEGTPIAASTRVEPSPAPGEGSFRMLCNLTRIASFDPVDYPGQPIAGPLHAFFGNAGVSATSTPQSIATTGNSTCMGGTTNRTAYWVPALYDAVTGDVQLPRAGKFYYRNGYNVDPSRTQPVPEGLRMSAGDRSATASQNTSPNHVASWNCEVVWNEPASVDGFIPDCGVGDAVVLTISFPECWDGVNLDAPNHRSHMAYAAYRQPPAVSSCPSTHPVQLPRISATFTYPVTANAHPLNWRLSSDTYARSIRGGRSAHASLMDGWSREAMTAFIRNCLIAQKACGPGTLGDGRDLVFRSP